MKERRSVKIDKEAYLTIKRYCDENALSLAKWLTKLALDYINKAKE